MENTDCQVKQTGQVEKAAAIDFLFTRKLDKAILSAILLDEIWSAILNE